VLSASAVSAADPKIEEGEVGVMGPDKQPLTTSAVSAIGT
jgi:hypothetical protein